MSKEIAIANNPQNLGAFLEKCRGQLVKAIPNRMLSPERLIRCVLTQCNQNPQLYDCTAISIAGCLVQAAQLGLEIGGPLGQAYMVPYNNKGTKEAQFQIGYKGLIALAGRNARSVINSQIVCEYDQFRLDLGTKPSIEHSPSLGDRGKKLGVYAVVRYPDRPHDLEWMSWEEIAAHRAKYSKQRGDYSPWVTAEEEMAKKTVIRRLAKRCPMSVELQRAASLDEYAEEGLPQGLAEEFSIVADDEPKPSGGKTQVLAEKLEAKAKGKDPEMFPGAEDTSTLKH